MATKKQIAANQANAARSTGPKTPETREISAQNSHKHGLLARTVVLEGESLERFNLLLQSLKDEFQPETSVQYALIETMAVARWRLMRLWALEKEGLSNEIRKQESNPNLDLAPDGVEPAPASRAAHAFRTLVDQSRSMDLINRYETRYDRQYIRSLDRLTRLRENQVRENKRAEAHEKKV